MADYKTQKVLQFTPWFETEEATNSMIHAYFKKLVAQEHAETDPIHGKQWLADENGELRESLVRHLANTMLLTPISPQYYIAPTDASPEQLWTRLAELDLGVELMIDSGLHKRQAQFEKTIVEAELGRRFPKVDMQNPWGTMPLFKGRYPHPTTQEEVFDCAQWAVNAPAIFGNYVHDPAYLAMNIPVEGYQPLASDTYTNGLTQRYIEGTLKSARMPDGSINPNALKKGTRLAMKIAFLTGAKMPFWELDQTLFRTWRECTVAPVGCGVKLSDKQN
mgnify:CR=1 FL=1